MALLDPIDGSPSGGSSTRRGASPTGKQLLRASFELFRANRRMIWLPIMAGISSAVAFLAISGLVAVPLVKAYGSSRLDVLYLYPGLVASSFLGAYFNLALVFAANEQIEGRFIGIPEALAMAWARRRVIFSWALLSATVGVVIQFVDRRLGIFGRLAGVLGGLAWAIANYMVIPILAFEDVGPVEAVKHSSHLLKTTFGSLARGALRFGALLVVWMIPAVVLIAVGAGMASAGSTLVGLAVAGIGVIGFFVVSMYVSAAGMYMRTILYRYATGKSVPEMGLDLSQTFTR